MVWKQVIRVFSTAEERPTFWRGRLRLDVAADHLNLWLKSAKERSFVWPVTPVIEARGWLAALSFFCFCFFFHQRFAYAMVCELFNFNLGLTSDRIHERINAVDSHSPLSFLLNEKSWTNMSWCFWQPCNPKCCVKTKHIVAIRGFRDWQPRSPLQQFSD